MPANEKFECWIESDGQRIDEHAMKLGEKENIISCWIPSVAGNTFSIHLRNFDVGVIHATEYYVDGVSVRKRVSPIETLKPGGTHAFKGVRPDSRTLRQFMFSNVTLTDDETLATFNPSGKLGTIDVSIFFVVIASRSEGKYRDVELQDGPMFENQKKIGGHRVILAEPIASNSKFKCFSIRPIDPSNPGPYVTFRFQYRSREFLIAQGIIPPHPSSHLTGAQSNSSDSANTAHVILNGDQVKTGRGIKEELSTSSSIGTQDVKENLHAITDEALEAEIVSRERKIENLRKERELQEEVEKLKKLRSERRLKREASPIRLRKTPEGVIDLTED